MKLMATIKEITWKKMVMRLDLDVNNDSGGV